MDLQRMDKILLAHQMEILKAAARSMLFPPPARAGPASEMAADADSVQPDAHAGTARARGKSPHPSASNHQRSDEPSRAPNLQFSLQPSASHLVAIVWGCAKHEWPQIESMVRRTPGLQVDSARHLQLHRMADFVRAVYQVDDAPVAHVAIKNAHLAKVKRVPNASHSHVSHTAPRTLPLEPFT